MKLDLLKNQWLEIVFEGRNKLYGAYELRKTNGKTTTKSLIIGAVIFVFLVSIPVLANLIPDSSDDTTLDQKITTVKLPPKEEKPKGISLKTSSKPNGESTACGLNTRAG